MPSGRPLPDLCVIAVFQMMPPNDQLMASLMAPRCALLVRAANRSVKTLIITDDDFTKNPDIFKQIKNRINFYSLAFKPSMKQLMDAGETFPDYLMTIIHLSKWNCLQLDRYSKLDTASIEQITNAFSAITDLKFFQLNNDCSLICEIAISLLNHPTWKCQLTNLMVGFLERYIVYKEQNLLIHAINGLTALHQLTIDWSYYNTGIPDLTILAQLQMVVFSSYQLTPFLRCLERQAADNVHLQVHLIDCGTVDDLISLSEPLRSRIVRYEQSEHHTPDQVSLLCSHFRSLTSLSICNIESTQVVPLFTAISQLRQLIHLRFGVCFEQDNEESGAQPPPRLLAKLNSLQALEMNLTIKSHSQIEWLNLSVTMPNLKTIYIEDFRCCSCNLWFKDLSDSTSLSSPSALACLHASLFRLHSGVPLKRLTLCLYGDAISAEDVLLQSE